jgi:hypothetical protein
MVSEHDEVWLLLPWLANGRLGAAERLQAEEHVRGCAACAQELEVQQRMCELLTQPERITYAPGPSLRKLMERIDGHAAAPVGSRAPRAEIGRRGLAATWRPPGLAWAATFLLAVTLGVFSATAYRWSQPLYGTYTSTPRAPADVLHVAFDPALPLGTVEELLSSAGARVVEGPGTTGVFGVAPESAHGEAGSGTQALRALAARLRGDPRVRWIEPLPGTTVDPVPGSTPVR